MYMCIELGGKTNGQARPSIAIYNMPRLVGERLSEAISKSGFDVLFEGDLKPETAINGAGVWLVKWCYGLNYDFLRSYHPSLGFISATKGVDHIDRKAMAELNLRADNCPGFSTISVAEHAIALAMRSIHGPCRLPPLSSGLVVFSGYSDEYAERAVAHMIMRARQIESSITRARSCFYLTSDGRRPSEPWFNQELSGARIGIIGHDRSAFRLVRMLKDGFDCKIRGHGVSEELAGYYNVKPENYLSILENSDYVFLLTDSYGPKDGLWAFNSASLPPPVEMELSGSDVAVLGTGAIGSTIARICKKGFGCNVRAFNRSTKPELQGIVEFIDPQKPISDTISDSNFSFISLPLNPETNNLITSQEIGSLILNRKRVLVNVGRDRIIESDAVLDFVSRGALLSYATDLVHNDAALCQGMEPDQTTQRFLQHEGIIPTPHEAEASKGALERLVAEVLRKLGNFMM